MLILYIDIQGGTCFSVVFVSIPAGSVSGRLTSFERKATNGEGP